MRVCRRDDCSWAHRARRPPRGPAHCAGSDYRWCGTSAAFVAASDCARRPRSGAALLDCPDAPASGRNKPSSNLLPHRYDAREVVMSYHGRPSPYAWGDNWLDDCPPPYYARLTFTHPPPAHARVALHLPPCQPRAGVNTDWSGSKCATLYNSSYALLRGPATQPLVSPSVAPTQKLVLQPPEPQASPSPSRTQTPVLQSPQLQALQPAPPPQPAPKPAADGVIVGQAAADPVHPEPAMAHLGFDVAVGLSLALAFAVVYRFILELAEPRRPSPEQADGVEHEMRR
jgi:hypothetical protein